MTVDTRKYSRSLDTSISLSNGFTLVEMLVIAPMVILFVGVFISSMINMTGSVLVARGSSALTNSVQDAETRITQDITTSSGYLATNNISLVSPQGIDDGTGIFHNAGGGNGPMLILNSYASSKNPLTLDRDIIYANTPNTCGTPAEIQNAPLMLNIVYFVKNSSLWRRVIAPTDYASGKCAASWQKPSCTSVGGFCVAQDVKLVDGIGANGFTLTYYTGGASPAQIPDASNSNKSDIERQTALQTAKSVDVNITTTATIAGRDVTKTGTIRKSLQSSATSFVITEQPASVTLAIAANAVFHAKFSDASATIHWEQSIDNGATWADVSPSVTSSPLTISSVTTAMDGYRYRALFSNDNNATYIISSSARLSVAPSGSWNELTLAGLWLNYAGTTYHTAGYRKTTSGVVVLKGLVKRAVGQVSGETIASLPVGYCPSDRLPFEIGAQGYTDGRIDILKSSNGTTCDIVYVRGTPTTYFSLEGIHFIPDDGRYSVTPVNNFVNGWYNFGGTQAPVSYVEDDIGRVHVQGTMGMGTNTIDTTMFQMPTSLAPPGSTFVPAVSSVFAGYKQTPYPAPPAYATFKTRGLGTSYLSVQYMYYPAKYLSRFTDLTLLNSWVFDDYGGGLLQTPQYTKATDGLVTLKGVIKCGTATSGTTIANLPAGYRPSKKIILTATNSDLYSRIDVTAAGAIRIISGLGTCSYWLSLNGMSFYADQ